LQRQERPARNRSFGEGARLTAVDRFGVWLSRRQIRRWLPRLDGKVVGDFGCGYDARLSRSLLSELAKVYLADVSLAPDLMADQRVIALQGALPATLSAIPDQSLDAAFCVSVLEHLTDPEGMLREMFRVLKPGGSALVNVPSWRGKAFLEFSAFRLGLSPACEMDDHKTYYDVRDLWPKLVAAGFRPSAIHCFPHKFGLNTFAACTKVAFPSPLAAAQMRD
jgi:SAM-dependent methyltransferase